MREERISALSNHLDSLVSEFAKETGAYTPEFEENKRVMFWRLEYSLITVEFVYTKKDVGICPPSTLFCRVQLEKNWGFTYHIPELLTWLDETDFTCYYFSYIENNNRMSACFSCLAEFIKKYYKRLNELAIDSEMCNQIDEAKKEDIFRTCIQNEKHRERIPEFAMYYEQMVLLGRFAGAGAYRYLLLGEKKKALKFYEKMLAKGNYTLYEKRLVHFLRRNMENYSFIEEECDSISQAEKLAGVKSEGVNFLLGALLVTLCAGTVLLLCYLIFNMISSRGSLYVVGAPWYWCYICGALPGIFGGIAFRRKGIKLFRRKKAEKILAYDELTNGRGVQIFANSLFIISLIGMILFTVTFFSSNTYFYQKHMTFCTFGSFLPESVENCDYEDLEQIIYSEGLYNDYGEFIERPGYTFVFADGIVWDSDGSTSVKVVEEHILPLLDGYYDEIEKVKDRTPYI